MSLECHLQVVPATRARAPTRFSGYSRNASRRIERSAQLVTRDGRRARGDGVYRSGVLVAPTGASEAGKVRLDITTPDAGDPYSFAFVPERHEGRLCRR